MSIPKYMLILCCIPMLVCGCVKEKEVVMPRDISADFPPSQKSGTPYRFVFFDGTEKPLSGAEIIEAAKTYKPDLLYVYADYDIDGVPAARWIAENSSEWGHGTKVYAGSGVLTTSIDGAETGTVDIFDGKDGNVPFVTVKVLGFNFVCGPVTDRNSIFKSGRNTIIEQTVVKDGEADWIVVCRAKWENSTALEVAQYYWPLYGYSECVLAKFGKDFSPSRCDFAFASEGVLNCLEKIGADPVVFNFSRMEQ